MSSEIVYNRTQLGSATLRKRNGEMSGDEERLMRLIDGQSTLQQLSNKVAPSIRTHLEEVVGRLLDAGFIENKTQVKFHPSLEISDQESRDEVQKAMGESQKFQVNMLALAEIEIAQRIEMEQALGVARKEQLKAERQLVETEAKLAAVIGKHEHLKRQVLLYKQSVQEKISSLQKKAHQSATTQEECQAQRQEVESELCAMRDDVENMQRSADAKEKAFDIALKKRLAEERRAEKERARKMKLSAGEMVMDHPHYEQVRRLSFFKDFHNAELSQLLVWAHWHQVKAGESIVREGDRDLTFYVLVSGKLSVVKGRKTIGVLRSGDPFGEMEFLTGAEPVRSASIVARVDSEVMSIDPAYLDGAELVIRMRIAEAFMRIQAKRLQSGMEMIVNLLAD